MDDIVRRRRPPARRGWHGEFGKASANLAEATEKTSARRTISGLSAKLAEGCRSVRAANGPLT
jgi:hypothetical protein